MAAPGSLVPGQDGYAERTPRGEPQQAEPQYRRTPGYRELPPEPEYARRPPPRGEDPYGDDEYGGPPPEYGYGEPARMRPPAEIGAPRRVARDQLPPDAVLEGPAIAVSPDELPPDAVLEGPAPGGRASDRSLFRGLFGG